MTVRFPIEAGGALMFARALGYRDPTAVVPPTYLQAVNHFDDQFPARPRPGQPWPARGAADGSTEKRPPPMHAEQHYEYHGPIARGDVLVAEDVGTRTWSKTGRRGGVLTFVETIREFRREGGGELVAVSRKVTVQPSRMPSRTTL